MHKSKDKRNIPTNTGNPTVHLQSKKKKKIVISKDQNPKKSNVPFDRLPFSALQKIDLLKALFHGTNSIRRNISTNFQFILPKFCFITLPSRTLACFDTSWGIQETKMPSNTFFNYELMIRS